MAVHARVADAGAAGSGLFATKDIQSGHLVLSLDRPLLTALDNASLPDACANCLISIKTGTLPLEKHNVKLQACSGCHTMRFCSKVRRSPT